MNKYKILSLFLAIALLAAQARIFMGDKAQEVSTSEAVFQNILTRSSIREYTAEPVSRTTLDSLCRAAMAAPTAKDQRPWKFVVIDDKAVLQELASALPYAQALKTAPAAIAICGDPTLMNEDHRPTEWWVEDCSAATQNILLAAHSLGLGAVWLGVYPAKTLVASVSNTLKLPSNLKPLSVVALGHPKGTAQPKDKYAKDNIRYNVGDFPNAQAEEEEESTEGGGF
ncbi:nitroreductase family protein [Alloprevotella rava]|uniref:Nitroreductase n=1 Tax=Alloprevotella rava TaxID=671218 RepID=A0A7W5UD75_9BACT|nr:nitroreductase family protein [Alloprevotella rava]MBB3701868.1 nitroreductase [Alloprevotella rava]